MNRTLLIVSLMIASLVLAACDTGDTAQDTAAAQNFQPNFSGYEITDADNLVDAVTASTGAGALASGNVALAAAMERANTTLACLQERGAISGQMYLQNENVGVVPEVGVSFVINKSRVERNLLNCVTQPPLSAQAVTIEPCAETGEFTFEGEEFTYIYVGVGDNICNGFETHFANLGG